MALDFQFPQAQPLQGGLSQPIAISLNTPVQSAPQTVPIDIDWSEYGASSVNPVAVEIDLTGGASPGPTLDAIRSVYIDNSFSFVPIYLKFPATEFIVICPANSIGMFPVLVGPGIKKAVVYAQDFDDTNIPVTTIHFMNIEVAGWVAGTGEFFPPVLPKSFVLLGTGLDASSKSTYTFTLPLGTEDVTRHIYALVASSKTTVNAAPIVTIDGVAASQMEFVSIGTISGVNGGSVGIWQAAVPTHTSGVVSIAWGAAQVECAVALFAGYNLTAPTVAVGHANRTGPGSISFGVAQNGYALAVRTGNNDLSGIGNSTIFGDSILRCVYGYQSTVLGSITPSIAGPSASTLCGVSIQ